MCVHGLDGRGCARGRARFCGFASWLTSYSPSPHLLLPVSSVSMPGGILPHAPCACRGQIRRPARPGAPCRPAGNCTAPKPACKPRSVQGPPVAPVVPLGGHLSGTRVTARLKRPTRSLVGASSTLPLLGLAPGGVCLAARVATSAGVLLPHRFTLAVEAGFPRPRLGNTPLCCTVPSGHPAWLLASTVLCGARTFLRPGHAPARDRPASLSATLLYHPPLRTPTGPGSGGW